MRSRAYDLASSSVGTFDSVPMGMSMTRSVAPAATFLLMIDASIWGLGSIPSGRWTVMKWSPAGPRAVAPVQENTPPCSSVMRLTSSASRSTLQNVSTKSAVPQALLIALEDSLGIFRPAAATMETTTGVILFPGSPPKLWKSNTLSVPNDISFPVSAMASA